MPTMLISKTIIQLDEQMRWAIMKADRAQIKRHLSFLTRTLIFHGRERSENHGCLGERQEREKEGGGEKNLFDK